MLILCVVRRLPEFYPRKPLRTLNFWEAAALADKALICHSQLTDLRYTCYVRVKPPQCNFFFPETQDERPPQVNAANPLSRQKPLRRGRRGAMDYLSVFYLSFKPRD